MKKIASSRVQRILIFMLALCAALSLTACPDILPGPEDETENETEEEESGGDDVVPPVDPQPTPVEGYDLALNTGDYWTFWWDWSDKATWVSSYDSGSDNDEDSGYLTITLGASSTIAGKTVFSAVLSGDIPPPWTQSPFWQYLGSDSSGLYASADGSTIQYIIEAATGKSPNSFFRRWTNAGTPPILENGSTSVNEPISWTTNCHIANAGSSYDNTIVVPGYDPIRGDEYTRTIREYSKPGLGPLSLSDYEYLYWRESASDSSTYITRWQFTLMRTSLEADDGFLLPEPVWESRPMPATKKGPSLVGVDGTPYLLLGGINSSGDRSMYRLKGDGTWEARASLPVEFSGLYGFGTACSYGGKIYAFVTAEPSYKTAVYAYDPAANSWSLELSTNDNSHPTASGINGGKILLMGEYGYIREYNPATKEFASLGYLHEDLTYVSMTQDDYGFYVVGQFNSYGDVYTTAIWSLTSAGWTEEYWSVDYKRRWQPGLAIANGRLYVFGGNDKTVASAPLTAGDIGAWTTHSDMLYGGGQLCAAVFTDSIRVFGSNDGTSIEIYHPDMDN